MEIVLLVLSKIKLAGISPDAETYRLVISTLVDAGEGLQAVEVCREGHAVGVLRYLPMEESAGSTAGAAGGSGHQDPAPARPWRPPRLLCCGRR